MNRLLLMIFAPIVLALFSLNCSESRQKPAPEALTPEGTVIPNKEYTADNPGMWEGMEKDHLPLMRILDQPLENILVSVPLENKDSTHYIEKIGIMDEEGHVLTYIPFSRHTRFFLAKMTLYPIPQNKQLKVFVKCNLHDMWTGPLENNWE